MKLVEVRILADENISPRVVFFLRQHGFDILDVKEQKWFGKEDQELLDIACKGKYFVLTHDADFGTLAINENKPFYGLIYLRIKNLMPVNVIKVCAQFLKLDVDVTPGAIVVVEEKRIRLRQHDHDDQ